MVAPATEIYLFPVRREMLSGRFDLMMNHNAFEALAAELQNDSLGIDLIMKLNCLQALVRFDIQTYQKPFKT